MTKFFSNFKKEVVGNFCKLNTQNLPEATMVFRGDFDLSIRTDILIL